MRSSSVGGSSSLKRSRVKHEATDNVNDDVDVNQSDDDDGADIDEDDDETSAENDRKDKRTSSITPSATLSHFCNISCWSVAWKNIFG